MKYIFPYLLILVLLVSSPIKNEAPSEVATKSSLQNLIDDGPYILFRNDSILEYTISKGVVSKHQLSPEDVTTSFNVVPSTYSNVEQIAVLSDVHGQYDLTTTILKNNGIIDEHLNWAYGNGHLVIVGDIFDRGDQVTELFWLVYKLEKQAQKQGGKVHFTLGNHEYMVMLNDLRYINRKYRIAQHLLKTPYDKLYDENSLLGRWLRSKNTILKINDYLFVHAGISPGFIENGFNLDNTNALMRQSLDTTISPAKRDSIYNKFYNADGPIWYRGYFNENLNNSIVKKLLKKLSVKHIIVGHTSQLEVTPLFKDRIIAVDTSIKNGIYGELLFIEDGKFYRGKMDGTKELLY